VKTTHQTALTVLLSLLCPITVFAQGFTVESKSPTSVVNAGTFTSLQGKFSIDLPPHGHGFQPLSFRTPSGPVTGDSYTWTMKEGRFTVGYVDANEVLEVPGGAKNYFDNLRDDVLVTVTANKGKLVNEQDLVLNDHAGREMKFEFPDGVFINRVYVVAQRMYQLTVSLKGEQLASESVVRKVFDSFRFLTDAEVSAALERKIAEATPSPLPQKPLAPKRRSDAEDEGLIGKVKSVVNESESLSKPGSRKRMLIEYYNERGNLIKTESFDWKGNPFEITVYGYLDGARVSKRGIIRHEYDPPPMVVANASGEAKPVFDLRYSNKFKYTYDKKGRQTERQTYTNDGKPVWRCVYSFTEKQKEETCYSSEKLYSKRVETLDVKGNVVEATDIDPKDGSVKNKRSFTYEFDAKGNWIKKTSSIWVTKDGRSDYEPASVAYRTITYY
jgi:hypothetical protein